MAILPRQIAPDLWLLQYPLKILGAGWDRHVTLIRLPATGALIIHSTAPFAPEDLPAIHALGEPRWIIEALSIHDTFSAPGHAAFPKLPFLAPESLRRQLKFPTQAIEPPPAEWAPEVELMRVEGLSFLEEYVMLHRPSRTLITGDLFFHFDEHSTGWTHFMATLGIGAQHSPGMSRPFRAALRDKAAFAAFLARLLEWDFDRLIPAHAAIIETGAKPQITATLKSLGYKW